MTTPACAFARIATVLCLLSLAAATAGAAGNDAEYAAWARSARAGCESQTRSSGKQDTAKFHQCMVEAHRAGGWVAKDRAERCRDKSGSFWGNRPGEREESEWQCLEREGRKVAESGGWPAEGTNALAKHESADRAKARRPACEAWARENLPLDAPQFGYVTSCMFATGSPAAVAAAMKLDRAVAEPDQRRFIGQLDTPEREANRAWCADHNAGGRASGLLRYDCACVDQLTAREQQIGRKDRAALAARRLDLLTCVDRTLTGERAVADLGGRSLSRLFESDDDIRKREGCYRSALKQHVKTGDLADDASLRAALEKRCR